MAEVGRQPGCHRYTVAVATIPEQFVDDLLRRLDIVDVVGRRIALKKAGREFQARCPFHDERSPSFTVSPNKQFYHCFGCGAHGSAIGFVMNYDGLEFRDAIEVLAQSVGMKVPRTGRGKPAGQDLNYAVLADAARFFREQLPREARAVEYLAQRGVSPALLDTYQIGYAPGDAQLLIRSLGGSTERLQALRDTGLLSQGDHGEYSKFRDRIMFPILDRRGRPIAFGGRILDAGQPKYLNSPETVLFQKGRELYGLWQARQANAGLKRLIVVEGYMDVVALAEMGLTEAVATLGTATSREQTELLFRSAQDVIFCFDGDRAGLQAAWRALTQTLPRLTEGRQAFFAFLPEGEDPDTLVRSEGAEAFRERLRRDGLPASAYFFQELERDSNLATLEGRARLNERALPLLADIPDGSFRDLMQQELRRKTGSRIALSPAPAPARSARAAAGRSSPSLVRHMISVLLLHPDIALSVSDPPPFADLQRPGMALLCELIGQIRSRPTIGGNGLVDSFSERSEYPHLVKLLTDGLEGDADSLRQSFDEAARRLSDERRRERLGELARRADEIGLADAEMLEYRELMRAERA